jgi:acyl-CoA reductase-like NAD-dependent aldehyde dehydrogenase
MWTLPIALVCGNTVVLKPSEKVPLTLYKTVELLQMAGIPDGVVNFVQGTKEAVEALIDHPLVRAVTFVGSSPVASIVTNRCNNLHKRVTALGGAKNHLIALPDCTINDTARDVVVSFAGCAGQRCMAASVLMIAKNKNQNASGDISDALMQKIVSMCESIQPGNGPGQMGPVIDNISYSKIMKYIEEAEANGAKILLDGRSWSSKFKSGNWIGPTIIKHFNASDAAMKEEIFGPVLSVYEVSGWNEAIEIENSNPFGNAACVYTNNGGYADWFTHRFRASMLGVNVGIPVPREPFSFGGLYGTRSKYGGGLDITGDGALEFFTNRIKVTSKWSVPSDVVESNEVNGVADHANFAGKM